MAWWGRGSPVCGSDGLCNSPCGWQLHRAGRVVMPSERQLGRQAACGCVDSAQPHSCLGIAGGLWSQAASSGGRGSRNSRICQGLCVKASEKMIILGWVRDSTANSREGDVSLPSGEGPGREGQAGGTITVISGRGPSQLLWRAVQSGEGNVVKQGLVPVLPAAAVTSGRIQPLYDAPCPAGKSGAESGPASAWKKNIAGGGL